jgi:hypothetical protein
MADSTLKSFAENGKGLRGRFTPGDAGAPAAACYVEFLNANDAGRYATASERFTLAEFLRLGHVRREKERLNAGSNQVRSLVQEERFDEAEIAIDAFRREPPTLAYLVVRDSLDQWYRSLENTIAEWRFWQRYESMRVPVTGRLSLSTGMLFLPWHSIAYEFFRFKDHNPFSESQIFSIKRMESAMTFDPLTFLAEAGYHVTPQLFVGASYGRASMHGGGAYLAEFVGPVRFGADFRMEVLLLSMRYYLEARTGFRPYAGFSLGYASWSMSSDPSSTSPLQVMVVDIREASMVFGPGVGLQYIPFKTVPLTLALSVDGLVRGQGATLIKAFTLGLGAKVGVII